MGREKKSISARKLSLLGLLLAFALILSYVEVLIPFSFGIPGVKLGLANAAVLLTLYLFGWREALLVSITRILLVALLFGSAMSFVFALFGGSLSLLAMCLLKSTGKLHVISISAIGGVTHNLGQLLAAALFISNLKLFYYFPVLLFSGLLTGLLIGIIAGELLLRIPFTRFLSGSEAAQGKDCKSMEERLK